MSTMMKLSLGLAFGLAVVTTTFDVRASGALLDSSELPAKVRVDLKADIDKARADRPDAFKEVRAIAERANAIDAAARRQGTPMTMDFKLLGSRALFPMLEMLAFDDAAPKDLTPSAREALRLGLVEAIGLLRDARSVPVLARVLEKTGDREADLAHVTADALGRTSTNESFTALTTALAASEKAGTNDKTRAILAGIGSARREAAAKLLAQRLDAHPDEATARVLVKALGAVGNAWAWSTLTSRSEEMATRDAAARALLKAYMTYNGDVREAAAKAFLVVDHPQAASLVEGARASASRETAQVLEDLGKRVAKNPTR